MTVTIYETDKQKLFDAMLDHLRQQGKPAVASDEQGPKCLYRTEHGLKCAIGALIPDELYQPSFEKDSTSEVLDRLGITDKELRGFLGTAQANLHDDPASSARYIGDYAFLGYVENNARALARQYGLTYSKPKECVV